MATVDEVAALDPAGGAPVPASSRLIGPITDSIALLLTALTLFVLSGITPIAPVKALATAIELVPALI